MILCSRPCNDVAFSGQHNSHNPANLQLTKAWNCVAVSRKLSWAMVRFSDRAVTVSEVFESLFSRLVTEDWRSRSLVVDDDMYSVIWR